MNSAEHYHRAEQLLEVAQHVAGESRVGVLAAAQTHATLALAHLLATAAVHAAPAPAGEDL